MKLHSIILLLTICAFPHWGYSQNDKEAIIYLRNGYSIKGTIVENSDEVVKIRSKDGQIFEYKADEIKEIDESGTKSTSSNINFDTARLTQKLSSDPNTVFQYSNIILSAGFSNHWYTDYNDKRLVPVFIAAEYCILDGLLENKASIGMGAVLATTNAKYLNNKYSYSLIGFNGACHYQFIRNLDTYLGLRVGYRTTSYKNEGVPDWNNKSSETTLSIYGGARYYMTKNIAGFVEIGNVIRKFNLGITYKL